MIAEGQPGHIDQIKQVNAGAVYRLIDQLGPVSRIELSKWSQLAPASITKIVRELLDAHLVRETDEQESGTRGRPAIGLILDTEAWHYLSVHISAGNMTLALRDLSSRLVIEEHLPLPVVQHAVQRTPLLPHILDYIDQFFTRHQAVVERLTAIAITLPGAIDTTAGTVHSMPFCDIHHIPLGMELQHRTGLSVYLQHNVCAWTMAEAFYGAAQGCRDVIQLVIDQQVGVGVITGGRLLHADSKKRIEFGHIQVDPAGKRCHCGNYGCLETVVSTDNLLLQAQQRLKQFPHSVLHGSPLSIDSLCQAALAGDTLAQTLINDVGQHVGKLLAMMVNLFNPEKILIGSPLNTAATLLYPTILRCIQHQTLPGYSKDIQVEATRFRQQSTMPGAALIKEALYNGSLLVKLLQG